MNPTPSQIQQALENHHRPARTPHARIRDAIRHAKESRSQGLAQNVFEQTTSGAANTGEQGSHHVSDEQYKPIQ